MTTIFLRYDNLKVYYPNTQLATLPIMNYYRSPDMGDAVDFSVNVATPAEKLALMKERLMQYVPFLLLHLFFLLWANYLITLIYSFVLLKC